MLTIGNANDAVEMNTKQSRRALLCQAMRYASAVVVAGGTGALAASGAAAQNGAITLSGGASQLFVSPGEAAATGAAASAAATRGLSRVQAAAALAGADSNSETFGEGAASLVAADPGRGAVAQSAATVVSALRDDDIGSTPRQTGASGHFAGVPRGRAGRGGSGAGRTIRDDGRRRNQVSVLPAAGTGDSSWQATRLFSLASVSAGVGALLIRLQKGQERLSPQTAAIER